MNLKWSSLKNIESLQDIRLLMQKEISETVDDR